MKMILSDKDILTLLKGKDIISDFNEECLQACSYDLTASFKVLAFKSSHKAINIFAGETQELEEIDIKYGYDVKPNEFVFLKTNEQIYIPEKYVGRVFSRTTLVRLGLVLCEQMVQPTFKGHLYLGFRNVSPNIIRIIPSIKIAQLFFETLASVPSGEKLYENKKDAQYQMEKSFTKPSFKSEISEELRIKYDEMLKEMMKK